MEGKLDKEGKRVNTRAGHPECNWLLSHARSSSKGPDEPLPPQMAPMGLRESVTCLLSSPLSVQRTELLSARLDMPGHGAALVVPHAPGAKATSQVEDVLSTPTAGHSPSRLGDRPGGRWGETNGPGPWAGKQDLEGLQWSDTGDPPANKCHWLSGQVPKRMTKFHKQTCVSLYREFECAVV